MIENLSALREKEFPLTAECVYLNHAASSPLPRRSAAALSQYMRDRERVYHLYQAGTFDYDTGPLRQSLATLLNCQVADIGFVPTTSDGIAMAINSIPWREGDNVVVPENDYPGVIHACLNLRPRGVEVRLSPAPGGELDLEALFEMTDGRTRAVAVSHVHWTSGYMADLQRLGEYCRKRGILTVIDAIQSVGIRRVDVTSMQADVLVAGGFKWLLGVPGTAVLYASPQAMSCLSPDRAGWMSMKTSVHGPVEFAWHDDALRFLVGTPCEPALIVLKSSVDLLLEVGMEQIEGRSGDLTDRLISGLRKRGLTALSSTDPGHRSGIVNCTTGSADRDDLLVAHLRERRVIVSRRGGGIRVAPHFYNSAEDIETFFREIDNA